MHKALIAPHTRMPPDLRVSLSRAKCKGVLNSMPVIVFNLPKNDKDLMAVDLEAPRASGGLNYAAAHGSAPGAGRSVGCSAGVLRSDDPVSLHNLDLDNPRTPQPQQQQQQHQEALVVDKDPPGADAQSLTDGDRGPQCNALGVPVIPRTPSPTGYSKSNNNNSLALTPPVSPRRFDRHGNTVDLETLGGDVEVRIPDFFASIMSIEPPMNPHYAAVKQEADQWTAR